MSWGTCMSCFEIMDLGDDVPEFTEVICNNCLELTMATSLTPQREPTEPDPSSYLSHDEYHAQLWSEPDPALNLSDLLDDPTFLVTYADDGIDVPLFMAGSTSWDDLLTEEMRESERDELDRLALVGDDGRDADGELMEERAEPHTRKVA